MRTSMPFFRAELTFIMLVMGLGVFLPLNTHADSGTNHPSSFINGFTIATLNTEWLWTPYDGKADGSRFNKGDMSPKAYSKELEFYRSLVSKHQIDILVVSEIENEQVAREMAEAFGSPWKHFFIQGRDTATGQDVGVLSRLPAISAEATAFGFPSGSIEGYSKPKRLSKVLGVSMRLESEEGERTLGLITSHFLSKRKENDKKAANRLMQAEALVKAVIEYEGLHGLVVLGDFNDVSHSPVIKTLEKKGGLSNAQNSCTENALDAKKMRYLIDHILFRGLVCESYALVDTLEHSDHPAVISRFRF